jgi:crotonobetainyl-CoA:carnitine CoA-transferase CaiB-like acyl-CoA transferase
MSGFAARTGFADREPVLPPFALADMLAGLYGAFATLAALRARERGKARGKTIDLPLLESIFSVLGPEAAIHQFTGAVKERAGSASNTSSPRNVYRCRDGNYVAMSASTETMARRVFAAIGRPDMAENARFSSNSARVANRELVDAAVGAWFAEKIRDVALEKMRAASVTVGPVYTIGDAIGDPHFRTREIIVDVADAELGRISMHNIVPRLSKTPGGFRQPAPLLGEHTDAVLAEAGFDGAAIAQLRHEGAIG